MSLRKKPKLPRAAPASKAQRNAIRAAGIIDQRRHHKPREREMTNKAVSYDAFVERFLPLRPKHWDELTQGQKDAILVGAWEECAWIETLTDQRLMSEVFARMPMIYG